MRTVTSYTQTETEKVITEPRLLVFIDFPTPLRMSSRGTVPFDGFSYVPIGFKTTGIGKSGLATTGTLTIANTTNAITSLSLNQDITDIKCIVTEIYGAGPWLLSDGVVLFDGVLDGADFPKLSDEGIFGLQSRVSGVRSAPRTTLGPPIANHLAPIGSTFVWAGEKFVVTE